LNVAVTKQVSPIAELLSVSSTVIIPSVILKIPLALPVVCANYTVPPLKPIASMDSNILPVPVTSRPNLIESPRLYDLS